MRDEWINGVFTGWEDEDYRHNCAEWLMTGRKCRNCVEIIKGFDTEAVMREVNDLKAENVRLMKENENLTNALYKVIQSADGALRRLNSYKNDGKTFSLGN